MVEELKHKLMVVSSCTGSKAKKCHDKLEQIDFQKKDKEVIKQQYSQYLLPAAKMYTGRQHVMVMQGVNTLREIYGRQAISLKIISAAYGLLDEDEPIVPYNASFSNMKMALLDAWAKKLGIREDLQGSISGYDLVFFLLGSNYLRATGLPVETREGQNFFFFAPGTSAPLIPDCPNYHMITLGIQEASFFKDMQISLKGRLFKLLCEEIVVNPGIIDKIISEPDYLLYKLKVSYSHKESKDSGWQLCLTNGKEKVSGVDIPGYETYKSNLESHARKSQRMFTGFHVKSSEYAANYQARRPVRYFIPDWNDMVDPGYDFLRDRHCRKETDLHNHDIYAHNIFPEPCYDGILVSLATLGEKKRQQIKNEGIKSYFKLKKKIPMMADCGAFNYTKEEEPPFTPEQVIRSYVELGFDYGVSVDHLIVGSYANDPVIRKRRQQVTQENAEKFINIHRQEGHAFVPVGVAQGWNPSSYYESARHLIELGYQYIALGSLVPKKTREIYDIMKKIAPIIPEYMDLHLFGVSRPEGVSTFCKLGVTSFDSAGPLRRAWLSVGHNYFSLAPDPLKDSKEDPYKKYAAIRIPYADSLTDDTPGLKEIKSLERSSLNAMLEYGQGNISTDQTLREVIAYEKEYREAKLINERNKQLDKGNDPGDVEKYYQGQKNKLANLLKKHEKVYRVVLEERPWEKCDCVICKEIGIQVIIFRGNNRNRRRGFHNTYIFYKQFKKALQHQV